MSHGHDMIQELRIDMLQGGCQGGRRKNRDGTMCEADWLKRCLKPLSPQAATANPWTSDNS